MTDVKTPDTGQSRQKLRPRSLSLHLQGRTSVRIGRVEKDTQTILMPRLTRDATYGILSHRNASVSHAFTTHDVPEGGPQMSRRTSNRTAGHVLHRSCSHDYIILKGAAPDRERTIRVGLCCSGRSCWLNEINVQLHLARTLSTESSVSSLSSSVTVHSTPLPVTNTRIGSINCILIYPANNSSRALFSALMRDAACSHFLAPIFTYNIITREILIYLERTQQIYRKNFHHAKERRKLFAAPQY
jgi:hypothetical protein